MSLPAYAEYKDSGVEWLGDVPKHWEALKIKWRLTTVSGGTPSTSNYNRYYEGEIPWIRTTDLNNSELYEAEIFVTDCAIKETSCRVVKKDSVLIAMYGGDGTIGKHSLLMFDAAINQAVCAFLPNKFVESVYLHFYVEFYRTHWMYGAESSRKDANIGQDRIGDHYVTIPSKDEQSTIVGFLEHETAKIDALIAEQQRLIELLKEKRRAVISHAVTKGLDPNAPMKDSGVEWLGDVPEHWVKIQLGRVCKQVSDGPHFSPKYVDDGIMFLSARNIGVDAWYLDDAKFISDEDYKEFCRRVIPERGDILYTKGGTTGVARVVDLDMPFQVWVHVAVLKLRLKLAVPDYVAFALNSHGCYEQAKLYTHGATNQDLGLTRMVKIWLALPSVKEQSAIVSFLNAATTKIDELISHAHQGIDLLKERRSALISAAVTGKIDVRGWQPPATAATTPQGQQQILFDD